MIIYNTTFQVGTNDANNLVVYLHEKYIPEAKRSGAILSSRMCRVITHHDEASECISVQFETNDMETFHKWYATEGIKINNEMLALFKNKIVGFPTMLEVIE